MNSRSYRTFSVTAALLLGLGGLTACSGSPEPEEPPLPEVLSASEAGALYLEAVCPVNEAWDEADVVIDQLRIAVARGDATDPPEAAGRSAESAKSAESAESATSGKTSASAKPGKSDAADTRAPYVRSLEAVAAASNDAAEMLDARNYVWPDYAGQAVADVRAALQADAAQAKRVAKLPSVEAANYVWQAGDVAEVSAAARALLELPTDGEFACAEFAEQQAEKAKLAEKTAKDNDTKNDEGVAKEDGPERSEKPDSGEETGNTGASKSPEKQDTPE